MNIRPRVSRLSLMLPVLLVATAGHALEEIGDAEMSSVAGRDGVEIGIGFNTVSASCVYLILDSGLGTGSMPGNCASNPVDGGNALSANAMLEGISLTGVNANGTTTGLPVTINTEFDVGAPGTLSLPALAMTATWSRMRFRTNFLRQMAAPTKTFGSIALDASGSLALRGSTALFDRFGTTAAARLILTDGELYYRQNGNEFLWDNLNVNVGFDTGTLGISSTGLLFTTSRLDFAALWDIGYRSSPVTQFVSNANYVPYLRYGWAGGLKDVQGTLTGGGVWSGVPSPATRSQGLNLTWQANADTDFRWIIGDAGGTPAYIEFTDWVNLPGITTGFTMPNVTLDVVNANQGPNDLTYKGIGTYDLQPDASGIAVIMRDTSFLNYNTKVTLHDSPNPDKVFDWALIYTLGDLDMDLYAYPGGKGAANEGVRFDLTLAVQSPAASNWTRHTHFMIGDTDIGQNVGVGFINTNFLITIDNGYLTLLPAGVELESLTDFRWRLDGQFGGGYLNDLSTPVRMMDLDLDLHASSINALFMPPPPGQTYVGFQWDVHFYQSNPAVTPAGIATADSYIALSEPSRPTVKFTLGQISGDLEARNGKIDLRAGSESVDGYPRLAFEQDLRFGLTAGTQPLVINDVSIGTNRIGALAVPGGNWYGGLALKEQL